MDITLALLLSVMTNVNATIDYVPDEKGKEQWNTYQESLLKGGNCNDYAMAYYELLLAAGVPDEDMTFFGGQLDDEQYHMVLAVSIHEGYYVLDSLESEPMPALRYFSRVMDVRYSVNAKGVVYKGHYLLSRAKMPKWIDYTRRSQMEKL